MLLSLEQTYPIVYLDALCVNSRQTGKMKKALYLALGINMDGRKEALYFYFSRRCSSYISEDKSLVMHSSYGQEQYEICQLQRFEEDLQCCERRRST